VMILVVRIVSSPTGQAKSNSNFLEQAWFARILSSREIIPAAELFQVYLFSRIESTPWFQLSIRRGLITYINHMVYSLMFIV
jgi:hypothetical protein